MVVLDLDHERRFERLPLPRSLRAPAARPTGRLAGETGRADQLLETLRQFPLFGGFDVGREGHIGEQTRIIVQAEEERADQASLRSVAEAADHALGGAHVLYL